MAIQIKRPMVADLFALGSNLGANGNNQVQLQDFGSYTPEAMPQAQPQQQGGGGMSTLATIGGKMAARGASNYATTGSIFGAGAGGAAAGSGAGAGAGTGVGYGLGGSLVSGGIGTASYAGGAAAAGAAAGAGAAGAGAAGAGAAGAGAAAGGAAAGGAAAGGASSLASFGPIGAIAALIVGNEMDSRSKGLRRSGNDYYKDLATGKVLDQDIEGKWAPMTDSVFGEKTGLGNDQRFFGDIMTLDFKGAMKNLKKSSLATGFGLWG